VIFNIQRYSTHDGEGIRTIVFFKGCTLRCTWCSNPESQSFAAELMYDERICKHFGSCIEKSGGAIYRDHEKGLVINRKAIANATIFGDVCPGKAILVAGKEMDSVSILHEIKKDFPYFKKSGGGVTLSGGEPLAREEELDDLIALLRKKNIHVSVETALHVPWEKIERRLGKIDLFLADLKHTNSKKLKAYTGGNARLIMNNFEKLAKAHAPVIIRVTVVPGFNDTKDEMRQIIDFAASLDNINEIHFIPFHTFGAQKYLMLGRDNPYINKITQIDTSFEGFESYALSKGLIVKTGG
jgi:pyruvate formate lyase activating enzyme